MYHVLHLTPAGPSRPLFALIQQWHLPRAPCYEYIKCPLRPLYADQQYIFSYEFSHTPNVTTVIRYEGAVRKWSTLAAESGERQGTRAFRVDHTQKVCMGVGWLTVLPGSSFLMNDVKVRSGTLALYRIGP